MTCVSYSTGQESKGLSRKSYRGRWIPGDPLTGSGGGCASPMFLQVQKRHPGKTQKGQRERHEMLHCQDGVQRRPGDVKRTPSEELAL